MIGKLELLKCYRDPFALGGGKEWSVCDEGKSVSADIVHLSSKLLSDFRDSDDAGVGQIYAWIFAAVIDLWTGDDLYLIVVSIRFVRGDRCVFPTVKNIIDGYLYVAGSWMGDSSIREGDIDWISSP